MEMLPFDVDWPLEERSSNSQGRGLWLYAAIFCPEKQAKMLENRKKAMILDAGPSLAIIQILRLYSMLAINEPG
jgi:hypothetical protein